MHRTDGRQKLQKPAFCNLIASIWRKGLTTENVISGFNTTGIFPVDENKYKVSRLDKVKLSTYLRWREDGSQVDEEGNPILVRETEESSVDFDVNKSQGDKSLHEAVKLSAANCKSPSKHKSPKKFPFSLQSFQDSIETVLAQALLTTNNHHAVHHNPAIN